MTGHPGAALPLRDVFSLPFDKKFGNSCHTLDKAVRAVLAYFTREMISDRKAETMTLDELKIGSSAVITAVGGDGALRCRLLDMGLTPRTRVTLQKVAPMGDPIEIRVRGYELTLRVEEAKKIEVEGVPA